MPLLTPPKITWEFVPDNSDPVTIEDVYDFSVYTPHDEDGIDTHTLRIRISNEPGCASAKNPICYIAGKDADNIANEDRWVHVMNTSKYGTEVVDEFSQVSNSNIFGYKKLSADIEPGTFIEFDMYISIPSDAPVKEYSLHCVIDYQYHVNQ